MRDWDWLIHGDAWVKRSSAKIGLIVLSYFILYFMVYGSERELIEELTGSQKLPALPILILQLGVAAFIVIPDFLLFDFLPRLLEYVRFIIRTARAAYSEQTSVLKAIASNLDVVIWFALLSIPSGYFAYVVISTLQGTVTAIQDNTIYKIPLDVLVARATTAAICMYIEHTRVSTLGERVISITQDILPIAAPSKKKKALPVINAPQPPTVQPIATPPAPPEKEPIDQAAEGYYSQDHGTDPNLYPVSSDGATEEEEQTQQDQVTELILNNPMIRDKVLEEMGFSRGTIGRGRRNAEIKIRMQQ